MMIVGVDGGRCQSATGGGDSQRYLRARTGPAPFTPLSSLSTKTAAMWNNDNPSYPGNTNAPYPPPGGFGAAPKCVVVSFLTHFRNGWLMISTSPAFRPRKDYLFPPSSLGVITQIGFSLSQWWIRPAHEPGHAASFPLGIRAIVPPTIRPTPERVRPGDDLLPSVRDVIGCLLGIQTQEVSRPSTLLQTPTIRARFQTSHPVQDFSPPPDRHRASTLLPLVRPPVNTSHLLVLQVITNGTPLPAPLPCHLEIAILDSKDNTGPVPSTRMLAGSLVSLVQT